MVFLRMHASLHRLDDVGQNNVLAIGEPGIRWKASCTVSIYETPDQAFMSRVKNQIGTAVRATCAASATSVTGASANPSHGVSPG